MSALHIGKSYTTLSWLLPLLIIVAVVLYAATLPLFYRVWTDENNPGYSHGPVLLVVVLYLLFKAWRDGQRRLCLQYSWFGLSGVFVVSTVWALARLGNIQIIELVSVIFILVMVFWSLLGIRQSKAFVLPLLLLLLSVPAWDFLNIYLRSFAALSVPLALSAVGIPAVQDDFDMIVPAGVFTVDAGCSGLNQFIVACVISLLYSYLIKANIRLTAMLLGIGACLAVVANILRIFIVVMAGQLTEMQHYLVTQEHVSLGWVVFAIIMMIFFILAGRLERYAMKSGWISDGSIPDFSANGDTVLKRKPIWLFSMLVPGLLAGPLLVFIYRGMPTTLGDGVPQWPETLAGWSLKPYTEEWMPAYRGADVYHSAIYENSASNPVFAHVFHYSNQGHGKEAVSDVNSIAGMSWHEIAMRKHSVRTNPTALSVSEYKLRSTLGRERIAWSWYYVNGVRIADPQRAKIENIIGILRGAPAVTVFVFAVDIKRSEDHARELLEAFLEGPAVEMETLIASID